MKTDPEIAELRATISLAEQRLGEIAHMWATTRYTVKGAEESWEYVCLKCRTHVRLTSAGDGVFMHPTSHGHDDKCPGAPS